MALWIIAIIAAAGIVAHLLGRDMIALCQAFGARIIEFKKMLKWLDDLLSRR